MEPTAIPATRRTSPLLLTWLAVLALATVPALRLGEVVRGGSDGVPGSESIEAVARASASGVPAGTFYPFVAVLRSDTQRVAEAQFRAAADAVIAALLAQGGATEVRSVWSDGDPRLVGRSGHSALLLVRTSAASFSEAELATAPLRDAIAGVQLPAGFSCLVTGQPAVLHDLNQRSSTDLLAAERIGLPITLLVLLLVFRSPVAAALPIALAMTATTIAMAALYMLSRVTLVSVFAQNTVTMIGLGVGVDYALLLVGAFRRALAAGETATHAAQRAAREVRSTIVCSGAAVAIGFLALSLVRLPFLRALVFGGVVVVAAAVLATLTLLPALLARLGSRVNWPVRRGRPADDAVGAAARTKTQAQAGAFWGRWARAVMRRPLLWAMVATAILAAFVAPVFRLSGWNLGASGLAADLEARRGYDVLVRDFEPGWIGPTAIVLEAPAGHTVLDDRTRAAVARLATRLAADPAVAAVAGQTAPQGRVTLLVLVGHDPPESRAAGALVRKLRSDSLPELSGTGLHARVTGAAAMLADFDREIYTRMRLVVPLVLLVTFVVLLVHLRSILIPLKAMALNLLSVLASYGFLILVFQDGHGAGLIGLDPPGGLNAFIVLMLFTILFGLSMDYEVFLLSSIRAHYLRSGDSDQAVAHGIAETGGVITSAAAIMISLFTAFGFTQLTATREFGLGLAFAVAFDASVVRLMLLPALMTLLGRANWWLPSLPRSRGSRAHDSRAPS